MEIESKSRAACFVATAVFNNSNHPSVEYLRQFRDNVLQQSEKAKKFIKWYHTNGHLMADSICTKKWLVKVIKACLNVIVKVLKIKFKF